MRSRVAMTFPLRTALVVLVLTAVTMGGAFAAVRERFVSLQRRHLDVALLAVAHKEAAAVLDRKLSFTDAPGPFANAVGPLPKYGALYAADGRKLSTTPNWTPNAAPSMPTLVPFEQGLDLDYKGMPMRGVVVAVPATALRVLLATPRLDLEDDARVLGRAMAVAFVVGCVWAACVAFWVATRLTREHRIVAHVARTVASGDTSARVQLRSSDADLRLLADDLNAMIERLVRLLAIQERFIARAAHELRTPLTSLRIELEHALRTAKDRADYDGAVRGALESATRLTDLAEDLLQLARVKAASRGSDELTAVEDALADAVADVTPVGRTKGVRIVTEPLSVSVRGDRRGLALLFSSVLENGVHFSPSGGTVRVEATSGHRCIRVRVSDDGPGIDAGDEERVFEPFARGRDGGANAGAGLGLSIARGLARAFGGDVTAEHGPGGRVFIELRTQSRTPTPEGPDAVSTT